MTRLWFVLTIATVLAGAPGIGTTATPARAVGPGQWQLGPPASYQAKHPALTTGANVDPPR